jgi:Ca2+/H+ antiporter
MPNSKGRMMGVCTAMGIGVGAALGVAFHNIPVWVSIGAALGIGLGLLQDARNPR